MVTRRTALAVAVSLTALAASGLALHGGCQSPPTTPSAVALSGAHPANGTASPSGLRPASSSTPAATLSGSERLDAARTVKLFCDLVESGRLWRAGGLCSTSTAWRRRELRALGRYTFLSARVVAASDPRTLRLLVRVRVQARRGTALHGAALHEGVNTLFFTLGRVGTTTGGWLITAIKTSP
jgi:hypothetical protein